MFCSEACISEFVFNGFVSVGFFLVSLVVVALGLAVGLVVGMGMAMAFFFPLFFLGGGGFVTNVVVLVVGG